MPHSPEAKRRSASSSYLNKQSLEAQTQDVHTLFIRNRAFMAKHNISSSQKQSFTSSYSRQSTNEDNNTTYDQQNLRVLSQSLRESSSELYNAKLHEFIQTQNSFRKYFTNSDQKMNDQIQVDCNRQRMRLLYGALTDSKSNHSKSALANHHVDADIMARRNTLGNHSFYATPTTTAVGNPKITATSNNNHNTNINNNSNKSLSSYLGHSSQQLDRFDSGETTQQLHQAIYRKTPSVNFSKCAPRKELFERSSSAQDCLESRFSNFYLTNPSSKFHNTISIHKVSSRRYEVFDCQMSEIKYQHTCETYQHNTFSSLPSKCLFDYNRCEDTSKHPSKEPATVIDSDLVIKGMQMTSPFKRNASPDFKKQQGREMKVKGMNLFGLQKSLQTSQQPEGNQLQLLKKQQQPHCNKEPHTTKHKSKPSQKQQQQQAASARSKETETSHDQSDQNQEIQPNGGSDTTKKKARSITAQKRNPLSAFREQRRQIHKLLGID